jgi:hypothetical protein
VWRPEQEPRSILELPSQGQVQPMLAAWRRSLLVSIVLVDLHRVGGVHCRCGHSGTPPCGGWRTSGSCDQYLGTEGKRQLRRRRRKGVDCELLAEAARAILHLRRRAHEVVGEAVAEMFERLVRELPRFQRLLVRKLAEKLPLSLDIKLEAIVRGIQVVGIWICVVQELPLEDCPCLQMMGVAELRERIEQEIQELLDAARQDIERAA